MKKLFTSMFLVLALLAMTAGTAFAQETTGITGVVESVEIGTDEATGETVVVVTLLDETTGTSQVVNINLEAAERLGLVVIDPVTGEPTKSEETGDMIVTIEPTDIIPEGTPEEEGPQHPVGSALSDFFSDTLGVDYETIMDYHDQGVGFGVIAQALWLSSNLGEGGATFEDLLDAKQSGDYSAITLADGSTPDNWGDVVRASKKGDNLGSVMSGRAAKSADTNEVSTKAKVKVKENASDKREGRNGNGNNGNGNNGNNNGNGGGNGNNNGGGNGGGNGNGNGGGNGNGNGNGG
jgi:hypothetical protein